MNREKLREEMIQVAAVAVAIVEDLDYGKSDTSARKENSRPLFLDVIAEVIRERYRQDAKWGPQHHDPETWLAILMEEVGESADEVGFDGDAGFVLFQIGEVGSRAKAWLERKFGGGS